MLIMRDGEYHVGNLLQTPLDTTETVELNLPDGQPVKVVLHNGEGGVTVEITGTVTVDDVCARCGDPLQLPVTLIGDEIETEIVNGAVNLASMAADEVELARPLLPYCKKCLKNK